MKAKIQAIQKRNPYSHTELSLGINYKKNGRIQELIEKGLSPMFLIFLWSFYKTQSKINNSLFSNESDSIPIYYLNTESVIHHIQLRTNAKKIMNVLDKLIKRF